MAKSKKEIVSYVKSLSDKELSIMFQEIFYQDRERFMENITSHTPILNRIPRKTTFEILDDIIESVDPVIHLVSENGNLMVGDDDSNQDLLDSIDHNCKETLEYSLIEVNDDDEEEDDDDGPKHEIKVFAHCHGELEAEPIYVIFPEVGVYAEEGGSNIDVGHIIEIQAGSRVYTMDNTIGKVSPFADFSFPNEIALVVLEPYNLKVVKIVHKGGVTGSHSIKEIFLSPYNEDEFLKLGKGKKEVTMKVCSCTDPAHKDPLHIKSRKN